MITHASMEFQMACVCMNSSEGSWKRARHLPTRNNPGRVHKQLISAGHLQRTSVSSKIVGSSLHGYSQEEQGAPFRNCWPSSKCKGTWELWAHLSRPSALGFLADALCRKEEGRADGWFADRLKILPGKQKAGWLLFMLQPSVTRSHEGCAQLGD